IVGTTRPYLRAVARVPAALDGEVCSTGFCVLRPTEVVMTDWLFYCAISEDLISQLVSKMRGANYPAVTDQAVLESVVPVPPVEAQQRIVQRIRHCVVRLEEMRHLREQTVSEVGALPLAARFEAFNRDAARVPLREILIEGPTNGLYKHA